MTTTILTLVGSLRAGSVNRHLAEMIREQAPRGVHIEIATGLDALPFYNEDLDEDDVPAQVREFRARVAAADRLLVVTPEYNGTMPAVIKNAIDWLSRPYGAGAIVGKPLGVTGVTPTPYGGKWAHEDTVKSARIAGAAVLEDLVVSQSSLEIDVFTNSEARSNFATLIARLVDAGQETLAA
ncbi:NAD(P)H-dependent oxidoreductase [Nocardioides sp.]|uniref:NAD(P)H-dependent oxidoreductase n=1 Tax=Nocardioides sp. TaxID=35761 RepID=UPI00356139F6